MLQGIDIWDIPPDIVRAQALAIMSTFAAITGVDINSRLSDEQKYAQLAIIWIRFFFTIDPQSEDYNITPICLVLTEISLSRAAFHVPLVHSLENVHSQAKGDFYTISTDGILRLQGMVLDYLSVCARILCSAFQACMQY